MFIYNFFLYIVEATYKCVDTLTTILNNYLSEQTTCTGECGPVSLDTPYKKGYPLFGVTFIYAVMYVYLDAVFDFFIEITSALIINIAPTA